MPRQAGRRHRVRTHRRPLRCHAQARVAHPPLAQGMARRPRVLRWLCTTGLGGAARRLADLLAGGAGFGPLRHELFTHHDVESSPPIGVMRPLLNAHPWFIRRLSWFDIGVGLSPSRWPPRLAKQKSKALGAVALSALGLAWLHDCCNRYSADFLEPWPTSRPTHRLLFFLN